MNSSKTAWFLKECERTLKDSGFMVIPDENIRVKSSILDKIVAAYSDLEFEGQKFPVIYSVFCISVEDGTDLGLFRFAIEIEGPYAEGHYMKFCEYASKITPHLLLGAVLIEKEGNGIKISLNYDAIVDLTSTNAKELPKMIFSLLSCGLMLIARRVYEIGTGNYEVLEDEALFLGDMDKLASIAN